MPPTSESASKQSNGMPRSIKPLTTGSPQAPAPMMQYCFTTPPPKLLLPSWIAQKLQTRRRLEIESRGRLVLDLGQILALSHRLSQPRAAVVYSPGGAINHIPAHCNLAAVCTMVSRVRATPGRLNGHQGRRDDPELGRHLGLPAQSAGHA